MFVTVPDVANIGDWLIYDTTTGAISTQAPGVIPGGFASANAYVDYADVTVAGIGVVTFVSAPIG